MIGFTVNGVARRFDSAPDTPLLQVIRDTPELTGARFGCGAGFCGACTVHFDGRVVRACTVAAAEPAGAQVTTIVGLSPDRLHPVQRTRAEADVSRCGCRTVPCPPAAPANLRCPPWHPRSPPQSSR